jgi:hypothetical protein
VLGAAGAVRALAARRGRAWLVLGALHTAVLAATTLVFQAGTQPRYFILIGTVFAVYSGVALGGIFTTSRRIAAGVVVLALAAFVVAPAAFPNESDLWIRRSARMRELVDRVHAVGAGRDVVWVADESACFYLCRTGIAIERYHAMPRADSDPAVVLAGLRGATSAVACVQQTRLPLERWSKLEALAAPEWRMRVVDDHGGYRLYEMVRDAGRAPDSEETR